jgi:hypothetical protein
MIPLPSRQQILAAESDRIQGGRPVNPAIDVRFLFSRAIGCCPKSIPIVLNFTARIVPKYP